MNMEIQCHNCKAKYQVDDAKVPDKGAYVRCKKCQAKFLIQRETKTKEIESDKMLKNNSSAQELLVDQYIDQDNQEGAAKLLCELISRYAIGKNFVKAEKLRNKLCDVAPLALTEIVRSAEIIEEQKRQSMDQGHLKVWADLYESLELGEAIELYYSMNELVLKPEDVVFQQGQQNANLYFVQEGDLKLFYSDPLQKKEIFLEKLSTGKIANFTSFCSSTKCTHSLVTVTETKLTYLEKDILMKWKEEFPGIESKLNRFCQRQNSVEDLIRKRNLNRRAYERVKTSFNATIQLLDNLGQPDNVPFKVTLFDISVGGLGYTFNLNDKEKAVRLLDQSLILQIDLPPSKGQKKIIQKGKIVAVNILPFGEGFLHVQFQMPLNEKIIEFFKNMGSPSL
jgi:predicted Zn finger-like uncharacterized protein